MVAAISGGRNGRAQRALASAVAGAPADGGDMERTNCGGTQRPREMGSQKAARVAQEATPSRASARSEHDRGGTAQAGIHGGEATEDARAGGDVGAEFLREACQ